MRIVNAEWKAEMTRRITGTGKLDVTVSFNKAAQWLIEQLLYYKIPHRVYNAGAGVKRITTDTDTCPLCKKHL